jgi:hypothetical protein
MVAQKAQSVLERKENAEMMKIVLALSMMQSVFQLLALSQK